MFEFMGSLLLFFVLPTLLYIGLSFFIHIEGSIYRYLRFAPWIVQILNIIIFYVVKIMFNSSSVFYNIYAINSLLVLGMHILLAYKAENQVFSVIYMLVGIFLLSWLFLWFAMGISGYLM